MLSRETLITAIFVIWVILAAVFLAFGLTMDPEPPRPKETPSHSENVCDQPGYCARV